MHLSVESVSLRPLSYKPGPGHQGSLWLFATALIPRGRSSVYSRKAIPSKSKMSVQKRKIESLHVRRHRTQIIHKHIQLTNPYPEVLHHLNQTPILSRERKEVWSIAALLAMTQARNAHACPEHPLTRPKGRAWHQPRIPLPRRFLPKVRRRRWVQATSSSQEAGVSDGALVTHAIRSYENIHIFSKKRKPMSHQRTQIPVSSNHE